MRGARRAALAAWLAACGGGAPPAPPALPAVGGVVSVLRLPAEGGSADAFTADSLHPLDWRSNGSIPALQRPLGYDPDQRLLFAIDVRGRLVGLDLETGGSRVYLTGVRTATIGPDGAVFAIDSTDRLLRLVRRTQAALPARLGGRPRLFGAANSQVVALTADSTTSLIVASLERSTDRFPIPDGPAAASFWGEVLAVADGATIRIIRTSDPEQVREVTLPDAARAIAFSPSGHRLFALTGEQVHIIDRWSGARLDAIALGGTGDALRLDPRGRWMLVRPIEGDSAWVIDLATATKQATVPTRWRDDLPSVSGASTVLTIVEDDVVSVDLSRAPPDRVAMIPGGAVDLWMVIPWVPPHREPVAVAAVESALAAQDSALLAPPDSSEEDRPDVYLQVSSSQNPEWAEALARQLNDAGFRATVWRPQGLEEGYRVVVGPFRSRDDAAETGRRLERPYFVVSPPRNVR